MEKTFMEKSKIESMIERIKNIGNRKEEVPVEPLKTEAAELDFSLPTQPMDEKTIDNIQDEKESLTKKVKASFWWTVIRTLIALIIIAVGIYLILYLVARAAKYETISAMLQSMFIELELMWQRIIY